MSNDQLAGFAVSGIFALAWYADSRRKRWDRQFETLQRLKRIEAILQKLRGDR